MVKRVSILILGMLFCAVSHAAVHRVPEDFDSIGEAVQAAQEGDTVRVGPGTYLETVVLDRPIHLIGEGPEQCILKAPKRKQGEDVLVANSRLRIAGLTIRDGNAGIRVKAEAHLEMENCYIIGNGEDGIAFEDAFNTFLAMRECLVTENGDGVDLEGTQGVFLNSRFVKNRDDGLDLDDDAGALVYGCTFSDNKDDGIEIRIDKRTHAVILNSMFERNGEDGIEVINSPVEGGDYNALCVQNSVFNGNQRFGVGFVAHKVEEHTGEMSKAAVYAVGNSFSGNNVGAVSPNYAPVFHAPEAYPRTVKVVLERHEEQSSQEIPVRIPLLVGIYNLKPTTDGTMLQDAEGVAVSRDRIYVTDDNSHKTYALDRRTGQVMDTIPTQPFPESTLSAPGPEGLDVVEEDVLLLADDDGRSLYSLSLNPGTFGHVLQHQSTTSIGPAEGVEKAGGRLLLASGGTKIHSVDVDLNPLSDPVSVKVEGFGSHIAGIGAIPTKVGVPRVFVTLSAYVKDQNWRNHGSGFFEIDADLRDVRGFWHLGPFSNDPRGIAVSDSLIYVADGRSDFVDKDTGEMNRGGLKVFVFMLEDNPSVLEELLPLLPVRRQ